MTSRVTVPVVSAVANVMSLPVTKYTQGFEAASFDSWSNFDLLGGGVAGAGHGVSLYAPSNFQTVGVGTRTHARVVSGLTVGRSYTFTAWVRVASGTLTASLGVPALGLVSSTLTATGAWRQLSLRFTAASTGHTLQLLESYSALFVGQWDDVKLVEDSRVTTTFPLKLKAGSRVTLDERRSPYAEAQLAIALPSQTNLALLDTRSTNQVRVVVTTGQTMLSPAGAPQARTFDLLLHERDAEHDADSGSAVKLICRSDEAVLIDAGNATAVTDSKLVPEQKSLRSMLAALLAPYNAVLEAGTVDADFTITTELVNLVTNPSAETNITGYTAVGATGTVARAIPPSLAGPSFGAGSVTNGWCAQVTATATAVGLVCTPYTVPTMAVTEGRHYWATAYAGMNVARNAYLTLRWFNASNVQVGVDAVSPTVSISSGWTQLTADAVAPVGATKAIVFINVPSCAVGNVLYTDCWMLVQSDDVTCPEYFDGSTTTTAYSVYYSFAWTGTAHASTSRRIRRDARDPKLLYQEPGEKDWDVAQQLVQVAGLRLFCDELRAWRLVDPATYAPAGTVALAGARRGRDRISREAGDWCDAVVIEYRWIDSAGVSRVAWDAATAGGTCLLRLVWNRPYPGPGAAAAVLARYQDRGRVQELVAPFDLTPTPGMALTTQLPNTPAQAGYVSSVTWELDTLDTRVDARELV